MIKYEDAEPNSVLPFVVSSEVDNIAISFAYRMAMRKIVIMSKQTMLYSNIDNLDEELLDLMALELRTQYYGNNLSVETKRKLIKNTIRWYQKAGTRQAMQEVLDAVFENARLLEWFEYGGKPGTFKIMTTHTPTKEELELFKKVLERVKSASSSLLEITTGIKLDTIINVVAGIVTANYFEIKEM